MMTLKGGNLLFFNLRVDPYSEGRQSTFDRVASPEVHHFSSIPYQAYLVLAFEQIHLTNW